MKLLKISLISLFSFSIIAHAEVSDEEAIESQLAGALASVDFIKKYECPHMRIDNEKIKSLLKQIDSTEQLLRENEDYLDQQQVLDSMVTEMEAETICGFMPSAHGGFADGIIN